jgi:hypothetical protein
MPDNSLRIKKAVKQKDGHLKISLSKDGKERFYFVHRLVALAFLPNPNRLPMVNHKDECPFNNRVENLEWCDSKYNINYGTAKKRAIETKERNKDKYLLPTKSVCQFDLNGHLVNIFNSADLAAKETGKRKQTIRECCLKKCSQRVGYIWRYHMDIISPETVKMRNGIIHNINGKKIFYENVDMAVKATGISRKCIAYSLKRSLRGNVSEWNYNFKYIVLRI